MKRITNVALNTALAGVVILAAAAVPARAQTYADEPGPGVARLSFVSGDVVVQRGDSGEFIAGELNAPLVALDHVLTGPDARAEIQFDWANTIRLAPNSELRLAALEFDDRFLQLAEGTATLSVLREGDTPTEVSTPTVSVRPLDEGSYRVTVRPNGSTIVSVRSGEVELLTLEGSEVLRAGRTMEARQGIGDPDSVLLVRVSNLPLDEWDRWNEAREREISRSDSYRYVSRDIYGADDLHRYGRWVNDPPYGWVWVPDVGRSWAPYRVGRWSWVDYYGWTWVSSDPWGWAPYHYGRWYHTPAYGWAWYPGGITVRHHWRPALVAFFGWGSRSGFNVSIGFGSFGYGRVGWVPLAPREIYRPWYGRRNTVVVNNRTTVVNNVNIVNNVNVVNTYRNARFVDGRTGVTGIDSRDFGRVQVNNTNIVQVRSRDLERTAQVRGQVPLEPVAESRRFNDRSVEAATVVASNSRPERQFLRAQPDRQAARRVQSVTAGNSSVAAVSPSPVRTVTSRTAEPRGTPGNAAGIQPRGNSSNPSSSVGVARSGRQPVAGGTVTSSAPANPGTRSNSNSVLVAPRRGSDAGNRNGTLSIVGPNSSSNSSTEAASPGATRRRTPSSSSPIIDIAPRRGSSQGAGAAEPRGNRTNSRRSADALPEVIPSPLPSTRTPSVSSNPGNSSPAQRPEVRRSPIPSTRGSVSTAPSTSGRSQASPATSAPRSEVRRAPANPAPQPSSPATRSSGAVRQSPSVSSAPATRGNSNRSVVTQPRANPAPSRSSAPSAGRAPAPSRAPAASPSRGTVTSRPTPAAPAPRVQSAPSGRAPAGNTGGAAPASRGAARRAQPR